MSARSLLHALEAPPRQRPTTRQLLRAGLGMLLAALVLGAYVLGRP